MIAVNGDHEVFRDGQDDRSTGQDDRPGCGDEELEQAADAERVHDRGTDRGTDRRGQDDHPDDEEEIGEQRERDAADEARRPSR